MSICLATSSHVCVQVVGVNLHVFQPQRLCPPGRSLRTHTVFVSDGLPQAPSIRADALVPPAKPSACTISALTLPQMTHHFRCRRVCASCGFPGVAIAGSPAGFCSCHFSLPRQRASWPQEWFWQHVRVAQSTLIWPQTGGRAGMLPGWVLAACPLTRVVPCASWTDSFGPPAWPRCRTALCWQRSHF